MALSSKELKRIDRLMPSGIPKYIRIYDIGPRYMDRYTVVFMGNYPNRNGANLFIGMSSHPYHPQGVHHHGE